MPVLYLLGYILSECSTSVNFVRVVALYIINNGQWLSFLSGQGALNIREMFLQKIMFLDDISGLFCV